MTRTLHTAALAAIACGLLLARTSLARAEEPDCMGCHADDARASEGVKILDGDKLAASVHATVSCTDCHHGAGPDAFAQAPHTLDAQKPVARCEDCHADDYPGIFAEHAASVHATAHETWRCVRCHDPHTMPQGLTTLPREERTRWANVRCLKCHREAVYAKVGADAQKLATSHDWLPGKEGHAKMRCVTCHTPIEDEHDHRIVPAAQATRDCMACHQEDAALVRKYLPPDDRSTWVTNAVLFEDAYVPGAVRHRLVDRILVWLAILALAGIAFHTGLRILTGLGGKRVPSTVHKEYLYSGSIRLWHWSNAALFLLLALSGFRMHFGEQAGPWLSFETAFNVHNLAGAALVLVAIFFFVSNRITGNRRQYTRDHPAGFRGLLVQARWYLFGIFKGEPHPYHASKETKFNPMQRVAYLSVMYLLYPLLVLTGVVLLFPGILPERLLGRPGTWWVAAAHYVLAACGTLFLIVHLYLGTTGDRLGYLLSGMITGWHKRLVTKKDDGASH